MKVSPVKIKFYDMSFKELMEMAEYITLPNDTYIKYFQNEEGEKYRYHCIEVEKGIAELHTDKLKESKKYKYHLASTYMAKRERMRLRKFIEPPANLPKKKSRKSYNVFLPKEERLKALESLSANSK